MDTQTLMRHRVRLMLAVGTAAFFIAAPRSPLAFGLGLSIGLAGEALRLWAAGQLRKNSLVTDGPYAMVRHPLYLGSTLLGIGCCVIATSAGHPLRSLCVWLLGAFAFRRVYWARVGLEEEWLEREVAGFAEYRRAVPFLLPDFDRLSLAVSSTRFDPQRVIGNREHVTAAAVALVAIVLRFRQVYRW